MKLIPLSQGKFAQVDDKEFDRVSKYKWSYTTNNNGKYRNSEYACSNILSDNGKKKRTHLHRFILELRDPKILVDHIDGCGLNCVSSNLRLASKSENGFNRGKNSNNTSGYKGVREKRKKWQTRIAYEHKQLTIGCFKNKIDAAVAYDLWAIDLHRNFAKTNFPVVSKI